MALEDSPRARGPARKIAPLVLLAAVAAIALFFGPKIPHDQVVHVVLGDAAPRVTEVRIRYAPQDDERDAQSGDFTREATFRYALGSAPRIVTHEPHIANGDYTLEIDVVGRNDRATVTRRVKLQGGAVSIDVREAVP